MEKKVLVRRPMRNYRRGPKVGDRDYRGWVHFFSERYQGGAKARDPDRTGGEKIILKRKESFVVISQDLTRYLNKLEGGHSKEGKLECIRETRFK